MVKVSTPVAPRRLVRGVSVRLAMGEGLAGLVRSTIWMELSNLAATTAYVRPAMVKVVTPTGSRSLVREVSVRLAMGEGSAGLVILTIWMALSLLAVTTAYVRPAMVKVVTPTGPSSLVRAVSVRLVMGEGRVGLVRSTIWMALSELAATTAYVRPAMIKVSTPSAPSSLAGVVLLRVAMWERLAGLVRSTIKMASPA